MACLLIGRANASIETFEAKIVDLESQLADARRSWETRYFGVGANFFPGENTKLRRGSKHSRDRDDDRDSRDDTHEESGDGNDDDLVEYDYASKRKAVQGARGSPSTTATKLAGSMDLLAEAASQAEQQQKGLNQDTRSQSTIGEGEN